jgi:hypothetical protein
MRFPVLILLGAVMMLTACSMFTAWRSIPAPGGCEECHKVPISANWQVSYRPATLSDERGGLAFQQPGSVIVSTAKPGSPVEKQMVEELACFECHRSPDASHKTVKGKFHH